MVVLLSCQRSNEAGGGSASPFAAQSSGVGQSRVQTLSELGFSSRNRSQTQISCLYISCNTESREEKLLL